MVDLNKHNDIYNLNKTIQILERYDTGYGYLIESDAGYISKSLNINEQFGNTIINEGFNLDELKPMQPILINCILQKWGVENRNGRIYPEDVLVPQVNAYQKLVDENCAISEVNHPQTSNMDLNNISHAIKKMWWGTGDNRNVLFGQLELFVTPGFIKYGIESSSADHILLLLTKGVKIGISSRGIGSLKNISGKNYVQNDFELVGFDLVHIPSTYGAYLFPNKNELNISETVQENKIINTVDNVNAKKLAAFNRFLGK